MKKILALAIAAALIPATAALAGPPAPKKEGIESKDYKWNAQEGEKIEALKLKGDPKNGKEGYEVCGACHLPSGAGRPDGTFPQLAGQHATVLIKQMADIRDGLRDNPTMYPFAKEADRPAGTGRRLGLYPEPVHPDRPRHVRRQGRRRADRQGQGTVREAVQGMPRRQRRRQSREVLSRSSPASTTSTCCAR